MADSLQSEESQTVDEMVAKHGRNTGLQGFVLGFDDEISMLTIAPGQGIATQTWCTASELDR